MLKQIGRHWFMIGFILLLLGVCLIGTVSAAVHFDWSTFPDLSSKAWYVFLHD